MTVIDFDLDLNLKTGSGSGRGKWTVVPDEASGISGMWELQATVRIKDFAPVDFHGVAHGSGDLKGQKMVFSGELVLGAENECGNPDGDVWTWSGVITNPKG